MELISFIDFYSQIQFFCHSDTEKHIPISTLDAMSELFFCCQIPIELIDFR